MGPEDGVDRADASQGALRLANLGLRFLLELAALASLAYAGSQVAASSTTRVLAAFATPLIAALVWGTFVAPKAPRRLTDPWRAGLEVAVFASASGGLYLVGRPALALALAATYTASLVLMFAFGQRGDA